MRTLSKREREKFEELKQTYADSIDTEGTQIDWRRCRLVFEKVVYTYHLDASGLVYGPGQHQEYPNSNQGKFLLYLAIESFNAFYKEKREKRKARKSSGRHQTKTYRKNHNKKLGSFRP